jgi:hypothetical protein
MHNAIMQNHRDIIRSVGHAEIAEATKRPITTVRSWDQRKSIPVNEWSVFIEKNWATAEQLLDLREEVA